MLASDYNKGVHPRTLRETIQHWDVHCKTSYSVSYRWLKVIIKQQQQQEQLTSRDSIQICSGQGQKNESIISCNSAFAAAEPRAQAPCRNST